ncbi:uncharacterized protein ColSpa_11983 [Colletotrichum spaethianum]|uniref:Uncharacterized protein n=1 Tax=Colletotrichum spaethianum TaxID=700344 RepID=A0AA37PGI3_9PEZI|nr:uncharacterized protein ColSpa_11983 [Colletotrichum spaethianum]GKT51802.1 hypothetical protein ColSpa_11983 [Colletotrichum spaethianum]
MQQGYATYEPEATKAVNEFYQEAKTLWKKERDFGIDHICTAVALLYLAITAVSLEAGAEYVALLGDCLEMSSRLGLFNANSFEAPRSTSSESPDWQRAVSQIAWALFNTVTYVEF